MKRVILCMALGAVGLAGCGSSPSATVTRAAKEGHGQVFSTTKGGISCMYDATRAAVGCFTTQIGVAMTAAGDPYNMPSARLRADPTINTDSLAPGDAYTLTDGTRCSFSTADSMWVIACVRKDSTVLSVGTEFKTGNSHAARSYAGDPNYYPLSDNYRGWGLSR